MKNRIAFFFVLIFSASLFARTDSAPVANGGTLPLAVDTAENFRDANFDYRSEDPGSDSLQRFSPVKFGGMVALTASVYGAAYGLVFAKGWWDDERSHFHFENDFAYAKNLDKAGHFMSGYLLGEGFYLGYYWSGLSEFNSYLAAGLSTMATHIAIDVKDGYSPEWGFSIFDVLSGSVGGFYPMARRYIPAFNYFDLKWSYWINSRAYYRQSDTGVFTDDYCNETFWLSLKIYRLLPPAARKYYPSWLALAAGWSIDEGVFEGKKGKHEFYIALDYDMEAIFKPHKRWARNLVRFANGFKLPAPTLQVYPDVKFFLLYPIKF